MPGWIKTLAGKHRPLLLILVAYVLLASAYSVVNPLYEASDELRHFRFVRVLAETGRLPVQGQEPKRSQSHHPPLYYALGASLTFWIPNQGEPYLDRPSNPFWAYRYWEVGTDNKNMYLHGSDEAFPWYGAALAAHLARLVNVGLGALTVALTAAIMLAAFPDQPPLGYGAAGLIAFNPMFLYLSGAVNNDVAAAAAGAAVTLFCVLLLRDGLTRPRKIALGIGFGLALMAKFNLAYLLALIELTLLYRSVYPVSGSKDKEGAKQAMCFFARANLVVLGLTAVIAGWWFVRNQMLYGDLTGFKAVTELWGVRSPWESVELAWLELPNAWSSLWGRFGYGQIPLPAWVYSVLARTLAVGGLGVLLGAIRLAREKQRKSFSLAGLILLLLSALGAFCVLFAYMLVSPAGSMGRFFFPGLPALVGLIFFGWAELALILSQIPRISLNLRYLSLLTTLVMLAFAVWVLLGCLGPAFAAPKEIDSSDAINNLNVILSDSDGPLVELLGYETNSDVVRPGDRLDITLYWHAFRPAGSNYVVFVHLLDEVGIVVVQRDTYPGLGNYVTSQWRPDHIFAETYSLDLPETAYAPATVTPQVGMYSRDWDFRLNTQPAMIDNIVKLSPLALEPWPGDLPNPLEVNFGDQVRLLGYRVSPRVARPGEELTFQFYWQVDQQPDQDYHVFVHVLGKENQIWAGHDARPAISMLEWEFGAPVSDSRVLMAAPDTPAGIYPVELGMWGPETDTGRLPIIAEDGHWVDDRLMLSPIRIEEKGAP